MIMTLPDSLQYAAKPVISDSVMGWVVVGCGCLMILSVFGGGNKLPAMFRAGFIIVGAAIVIREFTIMWGWGRAFLGTSYALTFTGLILAYSGLRELRRGDAHQTKQQ